MKKIILLLAFCLSVGNLFAQDANADKLREEGDAAMTAKLSRSCSKVQRILETYKL